MVEIIILILFYIILGVLDLIVIIAFCWAVVQLLREIGML